MLFFLYFQSQKVFFFNSASEASFIYSKKNAKKVRNFPKKIPKSRQKCLWIFDTCKIQPTLICTHCSKSSFFVQKFNFDISRKLSIFLGENLVKMLWFWHFSSWQLWFHEKNCQKNFGWKIRGVLSKLNFWEKEVFFRQLKIKTW